MGARVLPSPQADENTLTVGSKSKLLNSLTFYHNQSPNTWQGDFGDINVHSMKSVFPTACYQNLAINGKKSTGLPDSSNQWTVRWEPSRKFVKLARYWRLLGCGKSGKGFYHRTWPSNTIFHSSQQPHSHDYFITATNSTSNTDGPSSYIQFVFTFPANKRSLETLLLAVLSHSLPCLARAPTWTLRLPLPEDANCNIILSRNYKVIT